MGSDSYLMTFNIFKMSYPRVKLQQLANTINKSTVKRMYNKIIVSQLEVYILTMKYKTKWKSCRFIIVPGNQPALLGLLGIGLLEIITERCNTIECCGKSGRLTKKKLKKNATQTKIQSIIQQLLIHTVTMSFTSCQSQTKKQTGKQVLN